MVLWKAWFDAVACLRPACARGRTYAWMVVVLIGLSIRADLAGVTSFVRALGLAPGCYPRVLHLFHSRAIKLDRLTELWVRWCRRTLPLVTVGSHLVCIADAVKIPKEGRKMPAVKKLHQLSQTNSKPPFIYGHSFQAVSALVCTAGGYFAAVPLAARIHEGLVRPDEHKRTLLEKLLMLFRPIAAVLDAPVILVADSAYASGSMVVSLLEARHHLVTRVRKNAVGYEPVSPPAKRRPGRPRFYGQPVLLRSLYDQPETFRSAPSPIHGDHVELAYRCVDLLWRPAARAVRFVLVRHPLHGSMTLLCTDLTMDPLDVILLYANRFRIELGFRQAIHVVGAYAYHFWMMMMEPIPRRPGDQDLRHRSPRYRQRIERKLAAYHLHVQLGCIAQGLLQYLAICFSDAVWRLFRSWLRTMHPDRPPSELVVAHALRSTILEFLPAVPPNLNLAKFLRHTLFTRADTAAPASMNSAA